MQKYADYIPAQAAWLDELPSHWQCKKIGALFSERKSKVSDKDYAPLSVARIGVVPQLATAVKTDAGDNRKLVCAGDFVINSRSDRKGSCGVAELDGSVSLINIVLTPRNGLNERYVHYLLRSQPFSEEYYRNGHGIVADLWTTRYSEMKSILLPVPPRDEQNQIVCFLDWKVSGINKLIAVKQKQITTLNEFMQAEIEKQLYAYPVVDTVRLKQLGTFFKGGGFSRDNLVEDKEYPAILYGDIYTQYEYKTSIITHHIDRAAYSASRKISKGDIVMAGTGETKDEIGKSILYMGDQIAAAGGDVNASYFAFTATPKNKTLETFGVPYQDGDDIKHRPFHVYTMKQAIQEGFILDVLQYYTPIDSFYKLMKTVEDDPLFDRKRAQKKLRSFVESDSYTIAKKAAMMVDHFHEQVIAKGKIGGQARAMVVTSSIPRCIEYYYAINKCLADRHSPYKTIIAFSGENKYQGQEPPLTSAGLNGFPDAKIPKEFKKDPYRILIVADMFQTGFDEPLLHTMYVDKVLYDIKAVQTLSRLNRCCPKKYDTFVLDFANKPEMIQESFSRYYRTTILSGETDPNKLYDLVATMEEYQVFSNEDVERLVNLYLNGADRDKLDPTLDVCTAVYKQLDTDDQIKFKSAAKAFVRTYGFLGAILPYGNADWERLSIFLNLLIPKLPSPREDDLSQGILETIDLESYRNEAREVMSIRLEDADTEVAPVPAGKIGHIVEPEMDLLSVILSNFNDMFGNINWNDADNVRRQILEIPAMVSKDEKYQNAMRNSDAQSARLESERALQQVIFSIMADNMELFKQFQDNPSFKKWLSDLVFNLTYNKDGKPYEAPNSDIASKEN
mgnify:CR=1 FL=1